jgi:hypothetical protein
VGEGESLGTGVGLDGREGEHQHLALTVEEIRAVVSRVGEGREVAKFRRSHGQHDYLCVQKINLAARAN